jgi:uncharacterized membrane protein HdeD (DUF308 family)
VWHIIMAVIVLLGGWWGLIRPVNTFFALASVFGLVLIFYAAFEVARAMPDEQGARSGARLRRSRVPGPFSG